MRNEESLVKGHQLEGIFNEVTLRLFAFKENVFYCIAHLTIRDLNKILCYYALRVLKREGGADFLSEREIRLVFLAFGKFLRENANYLRIEHCVI